MSTSLFPSGHTCALCGKDPGSKPRNPDLFDGFRDGDTKQNICQACRLEHYKKKYLTEHRGKYTEMPLPIKR
jgi:hypothetical protein